MPSTVLDILAAAGAEPAGVVTWRTLPKLPLDPASPRTGIYLVSLSDDPASTTGALAKAPISMEAIDELLAVRPELTLDRSRPSRDELAARLAGFWFPDEVVLYIGLAGPRKSRPREGEVAKRVGEYFKTPLGARSPHAGGWPLKTLSCLDDLHVHYAYCGDVDAAEGVCIAHFAANVAETTRAQLHDSVRVMPFANLEYPPRNSKVHGIRGARAPKSTKRGEAPRVRRSPADATATTAAAPRSSAPAARVGAADAHHRSQNVTASDIAGGRVRIPIGATKRILPRERGSITVVLRGEELGACRWDPKYGPDRERSGIIGIGKAAASRLLKPGTVLAVSVSEDGTVALD